jgi:hypothetical protein
LSGAEHTPEPTFSILPQTAAGSVVSYMEGETGGVVWLVVAVVMITVGAWGLVTVLLRMRRKRQRAAAWLSPEGAEQWRRLATTPLSDDPTPWINPGAGLGTRGTSGAGGGAFVSVQPHDPMVGKELPLSVTVFSSTSLAMRLFGRGVVTRRVASQPSDSLDTSVVRMRCPECRRSFEAGTLFCPFDGCACSRDQFAAVELVVLATRTKVCPECKATYGSDVLSCERDETRLVTQISDARQGYVSVRAVVICARCQLEQAMDAATCARCQQPLAAAQVLSGRLTAGYPLRGVGPKTRICTSCGVSYAEGLSFCGRDGSKLTTLN